MGAFDLNMIRVAVFDSFGHIESRAEPWDIQD